MRDGKKDIKKKDKNKTLRKLNIQTDKGKKKKQTFKVSFDSGFDSRKVFPVVFQEDSRHRNKNERKKENVKKIKTKKSQQKRHYDDLMKESIDSPFSNTNTQNTVDGNDKSLQNIFPKNKKHYNLEKKESAINPSKYRIKNKVNKPKTIPENRNKHFQGDQPQDQSMFQEIRPSRNSGLNAEKAVGKSGKSQIIEFQNVYKNTLNLRQNLSRENKRHQHIHQNSVTPIEPAGFVARKRVKRESVFPDPVSEDYDYDYSDYFDNIIEQEEELESGGGAADQFFIADRPFFFMVLDKKLDLILLIGRVTNPAF